MENMERVFELLTHLLQSQRYFHHAQDSYELKDNLPFIKQADDTLLSQVVGLFPSLDYSEPVGPSGSPLLHALSERNEMPPSWLQWFASHAPNALYEKSNGSTVGSVYFERFFKGLQGDVYFTLKANQIKALQDTVAWWVSHAPLDMDQARDWNTKLTHLKGKKEVSAAAQAILGLLVKRGVKPISEEPGRPRERWSQKAVWWKSIIEENRLDELVKTPSGQMRPLKVWMSFSRFGEPNGFYDYLRKNQGNPLDVNFDSASSVPHGRRKELVEGWVFSSGLTLQQRLDRMALSISKTDGVLEELHVHVRGERAKKIDLRPEITELLKARQSSGMSLRGWFELHQTKVYFPPSVDEYMEKQGIDPWVAPDGAGLLLQKMRAFFSPDREFGSNWRYNSVSRFETSNRIAPDRAKLYMGDEHTHEELVNLIVDALVCPSPSSTIKKMASFMLSNSLLEDGFLKEKLEQAVLLSSLPQTLESPSSAYGSSDREKVALHAMRRLRDILVHEQCHLSLTKADLEDLFVEWKIPPSKWSGSFGGEKLGEEIKQHLDSWAARVSMEDMTQPSTSQPRVSRARL